VEKVTQALMAVFEDKYSDVRREAVTACGMIGPAAKSCVPALSKRFDDTEWLKDPECILVRRAAGWTCGRMGTHGAVHVDKLIGMMQNEGERAPEYVEALGAIGAVQDNVIPNIMSKLEKVHAGNPGEVGWFKHHAFVALSRFGDKSLVALPLTKKILSNLWGKEAAIALQGAMKYVAAMGPKAKDLVPEILAATKYQCGYSAPGEDEKARAEAVKAYKAVTGEDVPKGK
jgi:hypothetical protein